jgi:hypothetical protein
MLYREDGGSTFFRNVGICQPEEDILTSVLFSLCCHARWTPLPKTHLRVKPVGKQAVKKCTWKVFQTAFLFKIHIYLLVYDFRRLLSLYQV